jgi:hypothetical protein
MSRPPSQPTTPWRKSTPGSRRSQRWRLDFNRSARSGNRRGSSPLDGRGWAGNSKHESNPRPTDPRRAQEESQRGEQPARATTSSCLRSHLTQTWRCRQGADTLDGLQVPSDHDLARVALDQREGLLDDLVAGELTLLDGAVEAAGLLVADGYGDFLHRRQQVGGRADEPIFSASHSGLGGVEQAVFKARGGEAPCR